MAHILQNRARAQPRTYADRVKESRRRTLQDVANEVGLSKAATSYALRGIRGSDQTRERVQAAAARLGYTVDPIARALASGRSSNIAIVGSLRDLWQQGLTVMIARSLGADDLSAIIADADASPANEQAVLQRLHAGQIDGLLTLPVDPSADYWADLDPSVNVVSIGDALEARPHSSTVMFDNHYGVGTALAHLAHLGHREVGVIAPSLPTTPGRPAEVLARELGAALGLRITIQASPASVPEASVAARLLLSSTPRPTALFCLSDSIAFGAYAAARSLGLAVPGDLSILGFDDSEMAALVDPELTTFAWDEQAIVEAAVAALTGAGAGVEWEPTTVTFRPEFVERGSTAPPPQP